MIVAQYHSLRDVRRFDHLLHPPVARHAAPRPKRRTRLITPLCLTKAVHQVEGVQQFGRDGQGTIDALATLLEAFEHHNAVAHVDVVSGQRQGLGDAAAGGVQHATKGAHVALAKVAARRKAQRSSLVE